MLSKFESLDKGITQLLKLENDPGSAFKLNESDHQKYTAKAKDFKSKRPDQILEDEINKLNRQYKEVITSPVEVSKLYEANVPSFDEFQNKEKNPIYFKKFKNHYKQMKKNLELSIVR